MADAKALQAYLNSLADKIGDRVSQTLLEQAGRLSFAQRQELETLEQTHPTNDLLNSCTVVPVNKYEVRVQAGGKLTTSEVTGSGPAYSFDYATAFEFGDSKQPARPFFFNTCRAMKDGIQEAVKDAVNEIINE